MQEATRGDAKLKTWSLGNIYPNFMLFSIYLITKGFMNSMAYTKF